MAETEAHTLRRKLQEKTARVLELEIALQQAHYNITFYISLLEPHVEMKAVKQHFIHQLESVKLPIEKALNSNQD